MRTRCYVSGPISNGGQLGPDDQEENLQKAIAVGQTLFDAGYAPLLPQLSIIWDRVKPNKWSDWMELDEPWLVSADVLYRMPGESTGSDHEVTLAKDYGIPVYYDIDELINARLTSGDPRFHKLLQQINLLHAKKQRDYGREEDPFANVRASEEWGVDAWIGGMVRATDKVRRLQTYARKGSLANEGVEDSLMDLAVYSLIALILFQETKS